MKSWSSVASLGVAIIVWLFLVACGSSGNSGGGGGSSNPLGVATLSLPGGTLGTAYSTTLSATGGTPPYSWSITSGSLPAGLGLKSSGTISGTPTVLGDYPFTVQVADSQSPPTTASTPLSISVSAPITQLTIVTTSLPSDTQNTPYSAMLAATGGITPYVWSITAGSLPAGLSLNSSAGAITGTPTVV